MTPGTPSVYSVPYTLAHLGPAKRDSTMPRRVQGIVVLFVLKLFVNLNSTQGTVEVATNDDFDGRDPRLHYAGYPQSKFASVLKGTAARYSSGARWGNPPPGGGLSGLPFPFNPNAAGEVTVTIHSETGQIDIDFANGQGWTIQAKFQAGANLLWGFPSGAGAPSIKPMVLLSLSKHGV